MEPIHLKINDGAIVMIFAPANHTNKILANLNRQGMAANLGPQRETPNETMIRDSLLMVVERFNEETESTVVLPIRVPPQVAKSVEWEMEMNGFTVHQ